MQHHSSMSDMGLVNGATSAQGEARCGNARDKILLTLMLFTLVRSAEALAGDAPAGGESVAKPEAPNAHAAQASPISRWSIPPVLVQQFSAAAPFSATEFRPRPRPQVDAAVRSGGFVMDEDAPGGTTLWQQMDQFRSLDRVRLLTLWQTRVSTLSLQADKHGGPSLQWSSPWMNRDSASRGLFDHLFSLPTRSGTGTPRYSTLRPATAPVPKPVDLSPATSK
jgi:hypothetical protein